MVKKLLGFVIGILILLSATVVPQWAAVIIILIAAGFAGNGILNAVIKSVKKSIEEV